MLRFALFASLLVALALAAPDLKSPCPGRFEYTEIKDGQWTGNLILDTEYTLHGLWLRVFFDKPVKEVKPLGDVKELRAIDDDGKNFLLYDREYLLKKLTPTKVAFTVTFEGEAPQLISYRINARNVCPEGSD